MRIAVLNKDFCKPNKCSPYGEKPCIKYCPRVRTGDKTIVLNPGENYSRLWKFGYQLIIGYIF